MLRAGPKRQRYQLGGIGRNPEPASSSVRTCNLLDSPEFLLNERWVRLDDGACYKDGNCQLRVPVHGPCSSRSIAPRLRLTTGSDGELRDSDEVEVKELDELFAGRD